MAPNINGVIELLASDLASKGLMVTPVRDSILHALTVSNSDLDRKEIVNKLARVLNNELILIKNKILPFSQELKKEFDKILASSTLPNELAEYNIKENYIPEATKILLKRNKSINPSQSIGDGGISLRAPEKDIRNYFMTQDHLFNQELSLILDKYTDTDLYNLWDKYLANISEANINIRDRSFNIASKLEDYTLLIVVLENLKEEKLPNTGIEDNKYFLMVGLLLSEIYSMVAEQFKLWENYKIVGRLIIDIKDKQAIVDPELYANFLETGGSVEAILGFLVSGKTDSVSMFVNNIKEHVVEYEELWKQKVKYNSFSALPREKERFRAAYKVLLLKVLTDQLIPNDLKEHMNEEFNNNPDMALVNVDDEKILDDEYVINQMVSNIFDSTYYGQFTNSMLSYSKLNNDLIPQECATFAALDLIMDYILGSATISSPLNQQDVIS